MFVRNIKEFKKKTNKKKIICLDCGKKKVGVAISDENHKISMPMETLVRNLEFYKNINKIINDYSIGGILVGLPLNEEKKINRMSQSIIDTTKNLDKYLSNYKLNIPFFFWDENYTSIEAEDSTNKFFKNKKKQKKFLDKFAAKIILDDFLNLNQETDEKKNKTTT